MFLISQKYHNIYVINGLGTEHDCIVTFAEISQ